MIDTDKPLPARQQDVINLIVKLSDEHGYPPTLAELASALGLKNRMTVHQHVAALKKKGLVHWEPGLNRSLRVLAEGFKHCHNLPDSFKIGDDIVDGAAAASSSFNSGAEAAGAAVKNVVDFAGRKSKGSDFSSNGLSRGIPMAGAIAAGRPIDALESREFLEIDSQYGEAGCFALQVKGESMIEDGIYDGDFVIVKPNPSPNNGEVVVALLEDGSATLKRFYKERGGFRLQPANSEMEPIFVSGNQTLTIQGTVVALFRKM
ncbi:transcriptional repressor LexA [soil metagenome]